MSVVAGKRKLTEKLLDDSSSIAPVVKQQRTCEKSFTDEITTLSKQDYDKLKQYLKEKKKILKVRRI